MNLVKGGELLKSEIGKVVVCTPSVDGNLSLEYHVSLNYSIALMNSLGVQVESTYVRGDCFIDKARNNLVNRFLEREAETLFFIDADEGWEPEDFRRMVFHPQEIVAAAIRKKTDEVTYNHPDLITKPNGDCIIENGLLQANKIGSGFMRIKKSAIEKMIAAYLEKYAPGDGSTDQHYNLFERKIIDGQFWGEDLVFCKKWVAIGGKIWIDPNVTHKHIGRQVWEGNFLKYLQEKCKVELTKMAA